MINFEAEILSSLRENGLEKTIHFWNSGNSQFQNEASGKTKMDTIANVSNLAQF